MNTSRKIFATPSDLGENFALELLSLIQQAEKKRTTLSISLSGGKTPKPLFSMLADRFSKTVNWSHVHFFWSDERCVPKEHPDSNYGLAYRFLIEKIEIPDSNIHRIRGEVNPYLESIRYSREILDFTRSKDGLPVFDLIILGLGEDGHTASIFPGSEGMFTSNKICDVAIHPGTSQKRITLTGRVINNADLITFMVTGKSKAIIVEEILSGTPDSQKYPAAHIIPGHGKLTWLLDREAAEFIKE